MYGSTAKAISHYKDKQKITETPNFAKVSYLCAFLRRRRRKFLQPSRRIIYRYELDYFNYCRAL